MIRPTRAWRMAAVIASATLVLSACGSDDPETESSDEPTSAESPDEAAASDSTSGRPSITVVLNWSEELKRLAPVRPN